MPSCGLIPLYKALAERRYTPYFGLFHFNGGLYGLPLPCNALTLLLPALDGPYAG